MSEHIQRRVTDELLVGLAHTLSQEMRRDLYDRDGNLTGSDEELAERLTAAVRRVESIASKIESALQGA